jgi:hypothetical protein
MVDSTRKRQQRQHEHEHEAVNPVAAAVRLDEVMVVLPPTRSGKAAVVFTVIEFFIGQSQGSAQETYSGLALVRPRAGILTPRGRPRWRQPGRDQ